MSDMEWHEKAYGWDVDCLWVDGVCVGWLIEMKNGWMAEKRGGHLWFGDKEEARRWMEMGYE
jgi:hypothetical protein